MTIIEAISLGLSNPPLWVHIGLPLLGLAAARLHKVKKRD